jgi:hypothetical protein
VKIDVTSARFVLTKDFRGEVRRRVLLAMTRFEPDVRGLRVSLDEARNPLGGVDLRCRARAGLHSGLVLRAEAMGGQVETAVGRAVAHLALLVAEALDSRCRRPPPALRRRGALE